MRVGIGYDVHALAGGHRLVLGGVKIPHESGLVGHSDADVLTHAVMDALLGAAALGDIGRYFPDSNGEYKDISSLVLLEKVCHLIAQNNYEILNIDCTIVAQEPKLAPFIELIRQSLAHSMSVEVDKISVKATTTEGLGFEGRREGISSHAICALKRNA
jgi:2-C-methyl-D-erythritol 2,4-cyclodiphosphate synthase